MANERLDRFTKLLKEIFELDKSDLDFGIYRVMKLRKTQIENFLTQRLPQMVQETLAPFAQGSKEEIRAQMTQIEESVAGMGMTVDALPDTAHMKQKYITLQKSLAEGADLSALETDVYSALYSFFNRYYEDGDFISKRRYKEGVYAIPYEGEEVKLHWANQDQYYIKTSENFKDYTFVFDGITVHFHLVDATTEQNNNKESKRTFMLFTEDEENYPGIKTFEYDAEAREIVIRFVYDIPEDKKRKYAEENYDAIQKWILSLRAAELIRLLAPIPTGKGKETTTLLEKHLKGYVAKNTFDYFIHKDLRGFLTRELDFFIKSEVMHLEDLDTGSEARVETYLAKIKAIKRVGKIIIDFLAQIEDFQKKLWLKKKFVVETNWCITLDKIDESFWAEIVANKAQLDEWISMYAIDEADGWSNPPTVDFLRQNQNLIVDTKHFPNTVKFALLESISDLDEQTDGVMLHSDNFQALRLLLDRYREKVQLTYIDPPYNTDASKILYKNGYEHSSWVSLIESRLFEGRKLMASTGVIEVAIDDYEMRYLNTCMDQVFGIDNAISNIAILTNPKGRDQGFIAQAHDYTVMYARNKSLAETHNFVLTEEELAKKFSKTKDGEALRELPLKRTGSGKFREDRPYMYFPFFYSPDKDELMVIPEDLYKQIYDAGTDSFDDQFVSNVITKYEQDGYFAVLPLSSKGEKFRWRWGYKSCVAGVKSGMLFCKAVRGGGYAVYQYDFADEEATPKSLWFGEKYDASSKGTNLLENIIPNNPFDFPKSLYTVEDNIIIGASGTDIVLDYFAGSGTTGHAVVDLNRRLEDSKRKYILIDMGEHFHSVIHPRMKKVVYAPDWKDGKPQQRDSGVSQIIKYMRLESYEDALSNIELSDDGGQLAALLGEEYLIHYMVDLESRGSLLDVEAFSNPFAYTMKITEKNECKERSIDLCETFNYLIGLNVIWQSTISYFLSKPAEAPAYEGAVDLVSDINGQYAFRQIEGTLHDGRRALVIWRTVTDDIIASNAALDAYFTTYRKNAQDRKYDVIFVNGDSNLENLRGSSEGWKVQVTEIEFKKRMFEEV
ncbi:site-specific DNA-methyltransferase [Phascolarctobacterium faecium]|uniref:site-specific DNA-methyltransferase n=1 Tax=Phascolarctobacterium faecium TaxID=33025 RepID=UPI0032C1BA54